MDEDRTTHTDEEDRFEDITFLPPRHIWFKTAGISVAIVALLGIIWTLAEIPKNRNLATYSGARETTTRAPRSADMLRTGMQVDPARAVGTAGRAQDVATDSPTTAEEAALIRDMDALRSGNLASMVGRRVDLSVPVLQENSPVTFWIGAPGDRLLVVLHRDVRNGEQRQVSAAPAHGILTVHRGQSALISGTIQRVPPPEQRQSWNLTTAQRREVEAREVYLQADSVRSTGHGE